MKRSKAAKKAAQLVVLPEGLQIENAKSFYKDVGAALSASLGLPLLTQEEWQAGHKVLVYFRQSDFSPTVKGPKREMPALPLFTHANQSAWLVIELESQYGRQPLMLKHVSLKLWQGPTTEAASMSFRAEWDVRDANSSHAQPHWNVHAPTMPQAEDISFDKFAENLEEKEVNSFADFVQADAASAQEPAPAPAPTPSYGLSADQLHKFHFAMAANWHVANGNARPTISTTAEVVSWISSCALYIQRQFAFVMGV